MAHLLLNGSTDYASSLDSANLTLSTALDVRAFLAADDYTPSASQSIIAQYGTPGNRSWMLTIESSGGLRIWISSDGSTAETKNSNALGATDGADLWVRATFDWTAQEVKFYTGGSAATPSWSQLGATQATTAAALHNTGAALNIGSFASGAAFFLAGKIYRGQVYDGIDGTLVFDADFSDPTTWTYS